MAIDHTNSGIRSGFILFGFMLIIVVIKFTAPWGGKKVENIFIHVSYALENKFVF